MTKSIDRRSLIALGLAATATAPAAVAAVGDSAERLAAYRARFADAFGAFERFVRPHSEDYWLSYNRAAAIAHAHDYASTSGTG